MRFGFGRIGYLSEVQISQIFYFGFFQYFLFEKPMLKVNILMTGVSKIPLTMTCNLRFILQNI